MSYIPHDEQIDGPLSKMLDSMDEARAPILVRIRSDEYRSDHVDQLADVLADMLALQIKVLRLIK